VNADILELRSVAVRYGGVAAVDGVSFGVPRGSICGLVGPNGSGKSSLLAAISGGRPADAGQVLIDGVDARRRRPWQHAHAGLARTFQGTRLVRGLTVRENVLLGAEWGPRSHRKQAAQRTDAALAACRIAHLADADPLALPYGTQRLVEIARAVSSGPELLLLDEPTAGMSPAERQEIEEVMIALRAEGVSQLLVEHHMGMIARLCSTVFVLSTGRLIASGTPAAISNDPLVREAYLGRRG